MFPLYCVCIRWKRVCRMFTLTFPLFFYFFFLTFQEFVFEYAWKIRMSFIYASYLLSCQMLLSLIFIIFSFAFLFCLHARHNYNNKRRFIFASLSLSLSVSLSWQLSLTTLQSMKLTALHLSLRVIHSCLYCMKC